MKWDLHASVPLWAFGASGPEGLRWSVPAGVPINAHGFGEGLGPILDPALRCEGANEELYISRTEVWPMRC